MTASNKKPAGGRKPGHPRLWDTQDVETRNRSGKTRDKPGMMVAALKAKGPGFLPGPCIFAVRRP